MFRIHISVSHLPGSASNFFFLNLYPLDLLSDCGFGPRNLKKLTQMWTKFTQMWIKLTQMWTKLTQMWIKLTQMWIKLTQMWIKLP